MIRTLFLPEQIGSYYIFKKRIVCLSIEQKHVSAVCLLYSGKNRELLHSSKEPILFEEHENHELAVADAIKKTLKAVGSYTSLHVMINSSYGIFKELTIPLTDEEKIDQILGFEMEQFIPFPLHEAICDSIIISQDLEKKQSTVFAVAVPKTKIDEYIAIFNNIEIKVDRFLIDPFSLFGLYNEVSKHNAVPGTAHLLIVASDDKTTVLYLEENKLKKIRILQEEPSVANENWWNQIQFTFQSCTSDWVGLKEVVFLGNVNQEFVTKSKLIITESSHTMNTAEIVQNLSIEHSDKIENVEIINLSGALSLPITRNFDLSPLYHAIMSSQKGMVIRYATAFILMVTIYTSFGVHVFFEFKKFSEASETVKTKVLKDIKKALPALKANTLPEALRKAKVEIGKEEDIWYAFSSQTRHSFLTYLFDLSTAIDRETLSLDLKKMTFNKNGITIEGRVLSFDAVEELIKQLKRTNLFTQVPNLQKTDFVLPLTLANEEEQS